MARNLSGRSKEKLQQSLFEAVALGKLPMLKKMAEKLDKGDGIKKTLEITKDVKGRGAFHFAASHGKTRICQYLIEELGFDPDFRSDQGETPLYFAAMEGKTDTLNYLCNHGADPAATDENGNTPLHCAAEHGHGGSIEFLLSKGVQVDAENYRGTPLHVAAGNGQDKAVKTLLNHNADLNKLSNDIYTPLLMSILGGSLNCTKLLIKAGADLNLSCPLAIAIGENSAETVKCLLEAGADPNIPNDLSYSEFQKLPIEIAAEHGNNRLVEMLLPLTLPLPAVPNWTVEGIINYVKSPDYKIKHEIMSRKRFDDFKVKGEQEFRRKDYFAAIRYYSAAIEISRDGVIYANRSLCWLHMLEGQRALEDAIMASVYRPNWPKAYYRVGAAFMLLKKYKEAAEVLLDGFKLDRTNKDMETALRNALECMKNSNAT